MLTLNIMKKVIFIFLSLLVSSNSYASLYHSIEGLKSVISQDAFEYAYQEYMNAPSNCRSNILTINDFDKSRYKVRSAIIDLSSKALLKSLYVAHGANTDDGKGNATKFSNIDKSHQSSMGVYCTAETYYGNHGYSLRLDGLSVGLNNMARARNIVVHGAKYVTDTYAGRSHGCTAYSKKESKEVIDLIKGGSIVVVYSSQLKQL